MLMRVGGGKSARLSIPRDTIVDIPGHGRDKINAAYAYGGPGLATKTVSQYLGIPINHIVEVNFENFPAFIDSLGGINYTGGCVVSNINGGRKNGGTTLRLRRGTHHLNGEQALALARTRKNECNTRQNDLNRAAASRRSCRRSRAGCSARRRSSASRSCLAGAQGDPLRHGRPGAARPLRLGRHQLLAAAPRAPGHAGRQRADRPGRGQAARGPALPEGLVRRAHHALELAPDRRPELAVLARPL